MKNRFEFFDVIVIAIAVILLVLVLYPLILVLSNSFSDPAFVAKGEVVLFPKGFSLEGYEYILKDEKPLQKLFSPICLRIISPPVC